MQRSITSAFACSPVLATAAPPQSALAPAAEAAGVIQDLGIAMGTGAVLLALAVLALAVAGCHARARKLAATRWILAGGVVLPVVLLSVLLTAALFAGEALLRPRELPVARVQVIAKQWWWEVRYLPADARAETGLGGFVNALCRAPAAGGGKPDAAPAAIVLANELRLPVGTAVVLELTTEDVIHSFWVPALAGKVDMIPGRTNRLVVQPQRTGTYRGQCAEFCGGPHGLMAFHVVVTGEDEFRAWLQGQAAEARLPADPEHARGQEAFMRSGCADCHSIRGSAANGRSGPDLTHLASRHKIAAGTLDNHVGTLAGWIADPQAIKPGNRMPPAQGLSGEELRALAAYLASLD